LIAPVWRIRLGDEAEKDFVRILAYTQNTFGPRQAEIYQAIILEALESLGSGPDVPGSIARDEIRSHLRSLHVARRGHRGRHLVLYRPGQEHQIEVIRILHDAMDLARHIPPDSGLD
jgi:toxin ParE1/3/4